jgi:NAD(P)-dependent dehydrogenase (short-subunit alcohol dehydrogenase family)
MSRVAVVTGVSRRNGIGFAVARRLLETGHGVLVHSWVAGDASPDAGGVDAVLAELEEAGGPVAHVAADFADPSGPAAVIGAAGAAFGHVDTLVVNHTLSRPGALSELTAEDIDAHLQVNIRASLLLVKGFAAQHDGRPGGRICLLTSGQHLAPMTTEIAYAASKGALQQITATLSDALIDRGITVNTVNPGPTDTGWLADVEPGSTMPLGRWGLPDDAARLIVWLCSADAAWVTGQVIDSEGGFRRWGRPSRLAP